MNVMVVNKYKELLMGLNIEVMKSIEGVFNVDEIIYNFTRNAEGINYLLVHPHTYRDVVNIHNLQDLDSANGEGGDTIITNNYSGKMRIIGFKNMTQHAGATTLIYLLKKALSGTKSVAAIEVNKVDFLYFNDKELVSTTTTELPKELMKKQLCDIVFVDLNDYDDVSICSQVYYLIEPSTIMLNKMIRKNKSVLETLKDEKVVLNKCVLNSDDVATFEYETKLKVFATIPPVDDRQENIEVINKFISKMNL